MRAWPVPGSGVEKAYTADKVGVALTGILLTRQLWRALALWLFTGSFLGGLMLQVAHS